MLIQLMINGLVKGALIALAGLAFAIYYNTTRIFHIAFAGLYTLSCYFFTAGIVDVPVGAQDYEACILLDSYF